MRSRSMWVSVIALAACGGSITAGTGPGGTTSGSCTVTLSGALTGSFDCSSAASGSYNSSSNQSGFGVGVNGTATTPYVGVGFFMPGQMRTGTFKNTDASTTGGVNVKPNTSSNQTWSASASPSPFGSYTLNLTDIGSSVALFGGSFAYPAVHGTFDATLPALTQTGASGTVTLHAAF